jgi:hypothetical protein
MVVDYTNYAAVVDKISEIVNGHTDLTSEEILNSVIEMKAHLAALEGPDMITVIRKDLENLIYFPQTSDAALSRCRLEKSLEKSNGQH